MCLATAGALTSAPDRESSVSASKRTNSTRPGARADPYSASVLNELVRSALALGDRDLAVRLVAGVEPVTPLQQHALAASRAQLAEAAEQQVEAAAFTPTRPSAGASSATSPSAPTPCSARVAA